MLFILIWVTCALAVPTKVIQTTSGPVRGKLENGIRSFLSIPYAKPPIKELRFQNPEEHPPWTTVLECTHQSEMCPQVHLTKHIVLGNEDCLYMDIHTPPEKNASNLLPVLFWIYGGGWVFGDEYELGIYNVKHLIEKHDIIIVSVNYRVGAFGFMALEELVKESPIKSTGNNGLLDQLLSLKWTHENIKSFGGDPDRITIMGESAGAFSVCWHIASPLSNGLFNGAIMESGTCDAPQFWRKFEDAQSFSRIIAAKSGCNTTGASLLTCLRSLTVEQVMKWVNISDTPGFHPQLYPAMPWAATIDGSALPDIPLSLMKQGKFNKVPLLIGTNHDEGTIFLVGAPLVIPGFHFPFTAENFDLVLTFFFNNNRTTVDSIKKQYPIHNENYANVSSRIVRDFFFTCGTRRIVRTLTQMGHKSAWLYQFNFDKGWFYKSPLGDFHASELLLVFDNYVIINPNHDDEQMAKTFHLHWTNMIKYGSPNTPSGIIPPEKPDIVLDWPAWDTSSKKNMALNIPPSINDHLLDSYCDFWDSLI